MYFINEEIKPRLPDLKQFTSYCHPKIVSMPRMKAGHVRAGYLAGLEQAAWQAACQYAWQSAWLSWAGCNCLAGGVHCRAESWAGGRMGSVI